MHTRHLATAATIGILALTAACSSSSHDDKPNAAPTTPTANASTPHASTAPPARPSASATPTDTIALEQAVKAYSTAFFKPDPTTGYAMLSKRCQATVTKDDYAEQLQQAVTTYGHQNIQSLHIDRLSGTLATVTYTYPNSLLDQTGQAWVKENNTWTWDGC